MSSTWRSSACSDWIGDTAEGIAVQAGPEQITPTIVAGYIERRGADLAKPSVKQHLDAIRLLFDWLVTGQIIPTNPAHSVRGPKHIVKKGKTPILTHEETLQLLDSIDVESMSGLRDRALIAREALAGAGRLGSAIECVSSGHLLSSRVPRYRAREGE